MNSSDRNGKLRQSAGQKGGQWLAVQPQAWDRDGGPEKPAVALSHYFWVMRRQWWKMAAFIAVSLIATLIVSSRVTPIYESTATVDVDRQMPAGIIGQEATRPGVNDADQFLATQVKLIQSDSVIRPVIEQYKLRDTVSEGADGSEDAPVRLRNLKVTRPPNTYLLSISYRDPNRQLAADVANAISHSYIAHTYNIRYQSAASLAAFMEKQLDELKAKMERSGAALTQFERELNMINPEEKTSILSARLLQLNTEYTNAQTERVRKEAAYESVKSGSLEAAQVSTQGEALKKLSERLDEAEQHFAEIATHFGVNHPEYKKAEHQVAAVQKLLESASANISRRVKVEYSQAIDREEMLLKTVAETKTEFDRLNARSFEYQGRKREADGDKQLYEELVRKIREAGINAGFQNSAIRIADAARPPVRPVSPNLQVNLALAFLGSSMLSLCVMVIGDAMNKTIRDPEQVSCGLRTAVIGSLPNTREIQVRAPIAAPPASPSGALVRLYKPANVKMGGYEEAIRVLRNSILLADFDQQMRSLMVTSPSPAEGKSTVAAHLAVANAKLGKRTLLIDGDLRRPTAHRYFDLPAGPGLNEVLRGEANWQDVVVSNPDLPGLDLLLAWSAMPQAADIVGAALVDIVHEAAAQYDLVILDSPPLLGFSEPLQMARSVDAVIVVALAGQTEQRSLGTALESLRRLRVQVLGVVLNKVRADTGDGYYSYYHDRRYYGRYQ
jgi:polysaccharide biosynthesis transport protein